MAFWYSRSRSITHDEYDISCSYLLELLQRASDLFERSQPAQKNQLLRFVLANAKVEGEKLVWDLKSPFSGIAQCVKTKEWLPIVDQFQTADWVEMVEYPELVLQGLQHFLRPLKM